MPRLLDLAHVEPRVRAARIADGTFAEHRRGLCMLVPSTDDAYIDTVLAEARAVLAVSKGDLWFSHVTAALLYGAWVFNVPALVHVTHVFHPHIAEESEPMLRRHHTPLPGRDRAVLGGVPVTSIERTLVDCIRSLPPASALTVCDSLFRLGADPWTVSRIMTESRGKRGIVQARWILSVCDPRSASPGESVARYAALDDGLPRPACQLEVATPTGEFFLDLAWVDVRFALEFDGAVKYSGGEYGDPDEVRRAEARRQRALEKAGWIVLRVTWDDLADLVALGRRIRDAYRVAARRRADRQGIEPVAAWSG